MSSRETNNQLRQNITDQLDRLVKQLADLETYKDEMDEEEYGQTKADTKEQLQEFSRSLTRITSGDMSLVDELGSIRLALQAAISEAFKTPEIISMFAKKQPAMLRQKLIELERDHKINKVPRQIYLDRRLEIISALKKLGDELSVEEEAFLTENSTEKLTEFQQASSDLSNPEKLLSLVNKSS